MKREVFELEIGKRFRFNAMNYTVIRPYGEHDNVLAIAENGRVVKFPVFMACEELPALDIAPVEAYTLEQNSVCVLVDSAHHQDKETFLILENNSELDEMKVKVLETGLISSINPFAMVKVLNYGPSNS